ncbi:SRPBCC family protein [Cellulomonas sp. HZM]|uniref:SRPBCC family protein n=1 Tax=Cellulomonas sp. HZM TaxID=1454010 RepID=UPI0004934A99|nr:SRPBCC family protein [Cellulomonas sp. HZM]
MTTQSNPVQIDAPAGVPFIDIVREFDAPAAAVHRAHGDPALVARWMGPRDVTMDIDEWDFVSGGRWSYVATAPDGSTHGFRGTFHSVRDDFAVQTFEYLGFADVVSIETIAFEDLDDGRSRLRIHATYPSLEARDGMVASGMETGVVQGYEQLDEVLAGALDGDRAGA